MHSLLLFALKEPHMGRFPIWFNSLKTILQRVSLFNLGSSHTGKMKQPERGENQVSLWGAVRFTVPLTLIML